MFFTCNKNTVKRNITDGLQKNYSEDIVEEAVSIRIEDIIIVSSRNKRSIEDYFNKTYKLEEIWIKKKIGNI